MKKILITLALLAPTLTFASTNSVSIQPIVPVCGPQTIPVVVNATYWNLDGRIVTYLNGHELNHYNHKPTSITENITVAPGTYQFKARTYAIEWANHFYSGKLAEATQTFTVNACDVPPPPPVDMCPNLDGNQIEVPTGYSLVEGNCVEDVIEIPPVDVCSNIEGNQETVPEGLESNDGQCTEIQVEVTRSKGSNSHTGGSSIERRLCNIAGICYNRAETKPEAIPLMMQLFDLVVKLKQSGN